MSYLSVYAFVVQAFQIWAGCWRSGPCQNGTVDLANARSIKRISPALLRPVYTTHSLRAKEFLQPLSLSLSLPPRAGKLSSPSFSLNPNFYGLCCIDLPSGGNLPKAMAAELGQQTVDFSTLVSRAAEESFLALKELVEKSKSTEQSDAEKKINLLKYLFRTQQRMLKLNVLAKWCQQVSFTRLLQSHFCSN